MGSQTQVTPDIPALVSKLTLEEKISLLAGKDFWQTQSIDRLSIPTLKYSDGPNGARGALFKGGLSSACFPACVSLASTFDKGLAAEIGKALAQETRTKGATVLLGPTVCPHRDPRGGRNFESFSEDPFLAGELATEYIKGLQSEGVGATIKHYAVNESETKRFTIDARLSQRALREIYLKPFEIAVKNAEPWALMTSYNLINGTHADMNEFLIKEVLRKEWNYKGLVMSDWGGTNSTSESLNASHDLEMPGPASYRTVEKISIAIKNGELTEETIDERVVKNLEILVKADKFANPKISPEQAIDLPEHRQLIRHAGAEGIVLLKNDNNILPINPSKFKSIALIGLAKEFLGHGGGSAAVNAHHKISAHQALTEAISSDTELRFSEGARILRNLKPWKDSIINENGQPGFTVRVFTTDSVEPTISESHSATFQSVERPTLESITMTGIYNPAVSGKHYLSFATCGRTSVSINDENVFRVEGIGADAMAFLLGTASEERKQYSFTAGQSYIVKIEATAISGSSSDVSILANPLIGFNLGFEFQAEFEADVYTAAVEVAKTSDLAIIFVGNTPAWETEGCDRDSMDLPMDGSLDRLVAGCARVNKNTVVVNSTGSPITMSWIDDIAALVQAWFPGQEAGYAIADVLLGKVNPSGKLPVTFPKNIKDAPSYDNFPHSGPLEELHVDYEEDIFIGYRHYDLKPEGVLFPFGYGLSYTKFEVSEVQVDKQAVTAQESLLITAAVKNVGQTTGGEVVQVYVGPAESNISDVKKPKKVLAGWGKVNSLNPGETKSAQVTVSVRDAAQYWDEDKYKWVVSQGRYIVYVSTSSAEKDVVSTHEFQVAEEATFDP